jgi:aryl-alcohol dehydrogenase-like predicted oxidoreductase
MEYTKIKNLSSKISRIGLGTWAMGGSLWGNTDETDSIKTIRRAFDLGINFVDTAPGYGFGLSEEVIGKAIKEYGNREDVFIATKCGLNLMQESNVYRDSRKETILHDLEDSLRRLQLDYIDLYQVHWPDLDTPQFETAGLLKSLMDQGKIKAIGVCNYTLKQINEFTKAAPIQGIQHPFNLFERESEDNILAYCHKNGVASIGYSSLCRGLLTGHLKPDQQFEDLRKNFDPKFRHPYYEEYLTCVERLKEWVKHKYNKSLISLAVRWSLDKGVDIALWGARKPAELDPLDNVLHWHLTAEDFKEIDQIISETIYNPIGPEFMSPPSRKKEDKKI